MADFPGGFGGGKGIQKFFNYTAGYGHGEFFCKSDMGYGEGNGPLFSQVHSSDSRIHRPFVASFSRTPSLIDNFPYELIQYWR